MWVAHICVIIFNRLQIRCFKRQEGGRLGEEVLDRTHRFPFWNRWAGSAQTQLVFLGFASVEQRWCSLVVLVTLRRRETDENNEVKPRSQELARALKMISWRLVIHYFLTVYKHGSFAVVLLILCTALSVMWSISNMHRSSVVDSFSVVCIFRYRSLFWLSCFNCQG